MLGDRIPCSLNGLHRWHFKQCRVSSHWFKEETTDFCPLGLHLRLLRTPSKTLNVPVTDINDKKTDLILFHWIGFRMMGRGAGKGNLSPVNLKKQERLTSASTWQAHGGIASCRRRARQFYPAGTALVSWHQSAAAPRMQGPQVLPLLGLRTPYLVWGLWPSLHKSPAEMQTVSFVKGPLHSTNIGLHTFQKEIWWEFSFITHNCKSH